MLALNQVLQDRYRIIRQLGHGGMGAVYEAIDERFGEPIALKEIILELANTEQKERVFKAFEREAKALAKAKHEAVPYVRDYFSEMNRQFLVMELVEGDDLAKLLEARQAPFSVEKVVQWMDQLLDALDYLHHLKPPIIHRDIKPQNLKLNVRGKIKLLDFGIARSSDKSATLTTQTFVGATLNYSPVEQLLRVIYPSFREFILLKHKERAEEILAQDTDARCDIYALGGTFYHLLTNQEPVDATKRILEVWEGKPDPLPNPAELNPNLPPALAECLLKAMAIERKNRFSSALEMQEALKNCAATVKTYEKPSEAKTEVLMASDDSRSNLPAQAIELPTIDIALSVGNSAEFALAAETIPSGSISKSELIEPPYLNVTVPEEKKTSLNSPLTVKNEELYESRKKSNLPWILPIGLTGFLTVGAIAGAVWFSQQSKLPSNNSVSNVSSSATPTPRPSNITPTPLPETPPDAVTAAQPTIEPAASRSEPHHPKVVTTPNKTPTALKNPQVKATPKPKQDPNCILTNSCQ